jgi:hypothetical protein
MYKNAILFEAPWKRPKKCKTYKGKGIKDKVYPITGHEDPEGE